MHATDRLRSCLILKILRWWNISHHHSLHRGNAHSIITVSSNMRMTISKPRANATQATPRRRPRACLLRGLTRTCPLRLARFLAAHALEHRRRLRHAIRPAVLRVKEETLKVIERDPILMQRPDDTGPVTSDFDLRPRDLISSDLIRSVIRGADLTICSISAFENSGVNASARSFLVI